MQLQTIKTKIYRIRGQNIMFDFDLSMMYDVENRVLKQAVRRNIDRFPEDFLFQLTKIEWKELITNCDKLPEKIKHSPRPPLAFTEQGIAMLSSVLRSKKALQVNISIMRAFVFIRQYALTHEELTRKLMALEERYNRHFKDIYDAINYLLEKDIIEKEPENRKRIGY